MQFLAMEPTIWPPVPRSLVVPGFTYENVDPAQGPWPILAQEPNAVDELDYSYARVLAVDDNQVSLPLYVDQASRAFAGQQYTWFLTGRQAGSNFRDLLFALNGQRSPLWVPTFNDDIDPNNPGYFTNPHGRFTSVPGRDTAISFNRDGTFTCAPVSPDVNGNTPLPVSFQSSSVARVSFMSLKRLNQDSIEISHHSDTDGVATVTAVLRDAPDLRVPAAYNSFVYIDTLQLQLDGTTTVQATNTTNVLTDPVTITSVGGVTG
jgi:hypothetical protein